MLFLILFSLSCGCSSYCTWDDTVDSFNHIFVDQYNSGVQKTAQNWHEIKTYVVQDVQTSGSRLGHTLVTMYEDVDFAHAGKRLSYYGNELSEQIEEGVENTKANFRAIARHFCFCKE